MAESKTLLPDIANSPYFVKYPGRNFSQILFKPGYPLQSAELISLQNIINEQIKKFGDHIFKDGSLVTSSGGLEYDNCTLYELADDAKTELTPTSEATTVIFRDTVTDSDVLEGTFIAMKKAFVENGVVYPPHIGLKFLDSLSQQAIATTNTVKVYFKTGTALTEIGTLRSVTPKTGSYADIDSSIFYVSGYFTNISKQRYIYAVDNVNNLNKEVGVELIWSIVDINDATYGTQLYDPAENAFNVNSPGADRLVLRLDLKEHDLDYKQIDTDWKFIPLLKFKNGNLIFRTKYPIYSVLGETLARRTYEINGNFVVDNFKLNVESDTALAGTHVISNIQLVSSVESVYTIDGTNSNYTSLTADNYVMFGTDIDYNRLLKVISVETDNRMKVSDIHYDNFNDASGVALLTLNNSIDLRDEEKLNYSLSKGIAYVKGYRYETSFTTRLEDTKARNTLTEETDVSPNLHFLKFNNDIDAYNYRYTQNFLEFDKLSSIDLHCTQYSELYDIELELSTGFASHLSISINDRIEINGTIFENIQSPDTSGNLSSRFKLIKHSKNTASGLPILNTTHNVLNKTTGGSTISYTVRKIDKISVTPYEANSVSYTAVSFDRNTISNNTPIGSLQLFGLGSGVYNTYLNVGDFIEITNALDSNFKVYGKVNAIAGTAANTVTIDTDVTKFISGTNYTFTKPSHSNHYTYQYNSTKIGTLRAKSIGVIDPSQFRYSHFQLASQPKQFNVTDIGTIINDTVTIRGVSLELSMVDDVYNGLFIEYNGSKWNVSDYDGMNQEFTLSNVTASNPPNFSIGDIVSLSFQNYNVDSIVKGSYLNGTEFYGDVRKDTLGNLLTFAPTDQKKFTEIISSEDGEVKNVAVDDYSIFYQNKWTVATVGTSIDANIDTNFRAPFTVGTVNAKVYAAENIYDSSTNYLKYYKGESIPISTASIDANHKFTIQLNAGYNFQVGDEFIVHAVIPIIVPSQRTKTLKTISGTAADAFQVNVDATGNLQFDDIRYSQNQTGFELKHSDIYRIRKVEVGVGKTSPLIDLTSYFDLDTGQRETYYDHGRIVLKPYLDLPEIQNINTAAGGNNFYYFKVEYDYFDSTDGHYFTVDSYSNIHYRKIPTYVDPDNNKFPLRNVIDFRPVRRPIGTTPEYQNVTDVVSTNVNLDFTYYINKDKVIALQGDGSSEIALQVSDENLYTPSDFNVKLYDLKIPAYTFDFADVDYKLIDNKNYTMKDISKLQKRIENLEDIAQLNALELQAIQTKLTTPSGDPRFTNGLIVDMFSGFSIAQVGMEGFSSSIDLEAMKLFPAFKSNNTLLEVSPNATVNSNFPTLNKNIAFLPILNTNTLASAITTANTKVDAIQNFRNGMLTLHPFSTNWYSKQFTPNVLLNEDNQFKNWKTLGNNAFGTQWGDWEQFWSGVNVDTKTQTLANATLAQKTGKLINNKNNVETIINDKRLNNTLSLKSQNERVGFVLQLLDTDTSKTYSVTVNGATATKSNGQVIVFNSTSTASISQFISLYTNYDITQTISGVGTASGTINHIEYVSGTTYNLYVTNIGSNQFVSSAVINELNGTVSSTSVSSTSVDSKGVLCGDFTIGEGDFPTNTSLDVQIIDNSGNVPVASNHYYLSGLLETKSNYCQSIRPIQRKLYSNTNTAVPYIDDKTFILNSTSRVVSPLHQTFVLDSSCFISKITAKIQMISGVIGGGKLITTIRPIVNGNISPSLVLPFSEIITDIPSPTDGNVDINFDVPVFISANKEYAVTFRSEKSLNVYTTANPDKTIFVENYVAKGSLTPHGTDVLQIELFRAIFDTTEKQMLLRSTDSDYSSIADKMRVNADSLDLTNTSVKYEFKARNFDETARDTLYTSLVQNTTESLSHRKAFTQSDLELNVKLGSSNDKFTPMIDLDRLSITSIEHLIDDGKMKQENIQITRSDISASKNDIVQITLTENDPTNVNTRTCVLVVNTNGTITNFFSDPNFLLHVKDYTLSIKTFNTTTNVFENYSGANVPTSITKNEIIFGSGKIEVDVVTEFDVVKGKTGNVSNRYFSPVVTLADNFEAMQLYVQMDSILKRTNEVFVYYRVLDSSSDFSTFNDQEFKIMELKTNIADKYSNNNLAKTLEFETSRDSVQDSRFKYFQVKVCFTSSDPVQIPVTENIRILALDN